MQTRAKPYLTFGKPARLGQIPKSCPTDAFEDIPNKVAFSEHPEQMGFAIIPEGCEPQPFENTDPQPTWSLWVREGGRWGLAAKAAVPPYDTSGIFPGALAARQVEELFGEFCIQMEEGVIEEARIVAPSA